MGRVAVHVGLPKTGTTWLQGLLARHREPLRAAGVLSPAPRPGAMFQGAVEVRGSHEKFGLAASDVAGAWQLVCDRARDFDGTTVLGHEVLGGATPDQVARAMAPLAGLEVHVVVTARDLGRQAVAHWQEEVKLGDPRSFAEFERTELRADSGRDLGPDSGGVRPRFWHAQDVADALRRWSAGLPPERVHLVTGPPPGSSPALLWQRFAEACGLDAGLVDAAAAPPANTSLGAPEIALLRELHALLAARRPPVDAGTRLRVLKREYAEQVLAARLSNPARTPASLRPLLEEVTAGWIAEIRAAGYAVHGDLADLTPVTGDPGDPPPDVPPPPDLDPSAELERLLPAPRSSSLSRRRWRR
jgi:hypothetical protein